MLLFLDFDRTLHPLWTFERGEESVIALPSTYTESTWLPDLALDYHASR